ncbi:UDP-N-acetylmuramoyl-tripeptide--D-alanyl-D-alanine ligase [Psychroflexus lacisalsi]|jgi:UDP-N-acetylmuramoyl-tripeptide--D-alanyl-D-alanine ligase|uniref:UDP-N-acetylmuramoyl-tripeptide--D-alanyl-D-alanine ligase n=1 Tax=Psychroflexus lacisalsi TaxID=503928 RepID=A0ABP3V8Q8_9FLAO|nr:UDP-N-acetylmuramoyl-tripeptide--D-alanyl-D-alanine ligase [Psychroflexus lacisalsi]MBZ9620854.1 UDP-N-acetylmuramoyl-tripeptide--D-alanyl-D-alanine ligase [Psychroflexus lacisalsi]
MKNISDLYSKFLESSGICTDTRKLKKNSIYFALKGENFDGNEYADQALERGALLAVVDDKNQKDDSKVIVEDVLLTLQELANFHRKQIDIPILAITGSNGKTTTKKLVLEVLSKEFKVKATEGNLNNHIGVPLTLLSFTAELDFGIVEMGANHQKEIESLCNIAEPNYGYITNFGKAHLEGFGGIEGVIKGKSELYDYLIENDGLIFFNRDDEIQVEKAIQHKNYSIGEKSLSDCQVVLMETQPFVTVEYSNLIIETKLVGSYNFKNVSASIGIGRYFGVDKENIKQAIENFVPEEMRSQIIEKNGKHILLDAYNANPTSMKAVLESFKQMKGDHKTVILGDMFEIGEDSVKEHFHILDTCQYLGFENILVCGERFHKVSSEFENVIGFKTTSDLQKYIEEDISRISSPILVKGSRGMKLESIMDVL